MSQWKQTLSMVLALAGGFVLSNVGFGLLWAGAGWPYQFLMALPFLALGLGTARFVGPWALLALVGALPVGSLMVRFRDSSGSHLMAILIVGSWVVGTGLGVYLGHRSKTKPSADA